MPSNIAQNSDFCKVKNPLLTIDGFDAKEYYNSLALVIQYLDYKNYGEQLDCVVLHIEQLRELFLEWHLEYLRQEIKSN